MRIGGKINYICNQNIAIINTKLKNVNITHGQARIIKIISENQRMSQEHLTKLLQIDKSAVTRLLKGMENRKLIKKIVSCHDKRSYEIILTEKGQGLYQFVDDVFDETSKMMLNNFTQDEVEQLYQLLKKIEKNMEGKKNE